MIDKKKIEQIVRFSETAAAKLKQQVKFKNRYERFNVCFKLDRGSDILLQKRKYLRRVIDFKNQISLRKNRSNFYVLGNFDSAKIESIAKKYDMNGNKIYAGKKMVLDCLKIKKNYRSLKAILVLKNELLIVKKFMKKLSTQKKLPKLFLKTIFNNDNELLDGLEKFVSGKRQFYHFNFTKCNSYISVCVGDNLVSNQQVSRNVIDFYRVLVDEISSLPLTKRAVKNHWCFKLESFFLSGTMTSISDVFFLNNI